MRKVIVGILIGFVLAFSTNAFAAVGDKVTAIFAEYKYKVNGEEKVLDSPVLVVDGNSYLRTTQVANLLGYDVTYKADNRTIEFNGSLPAATPEPTAKPAEDITETSGTVTDGTKEIIDGSEPSPTPSSTPTPTPTPDNTAACQAIRDDYAYKIGMTQYTSGTIGQQRLAVIQIEYERNQALSAAGC